MSTPIGRGATTADMNARAQAARVKAMTVERVKAKLIEILGEAAVGGAESLAERVMEKLASAEPTGGLTYFGSKLGNCYWGYSAIVFGDCVMPGGNGGPAGAKTDIQDSLLGRVRTCYYTIDSGD